MHRTLRPRGPHASFHATKSLRVSASILKRINDEQAKSGERTHPYLSGTNPKTSGPSKLWPLSKHGKMRLNAHGPGPEPQDAGRVLCILMIPRELDVF
jgi:hypothetical protein